MTITTKAFSENYDIQESWIRRHIESFKEDSFVNIELAEKGN